MTSTNPTTGGGRTPAPAPKRGRPPKQRAAVAPQMSEEALMQTVLDLCAYRHVWAVHFPPSYTARGRIVTLYRGDGNGWPDLHITGPGGVLYRELKSADGRLTPAQQQYLDKLTAAGQDADVWRPADWKSERIAREIDAIAKPRTPKGTPHGLRP